jgi:hypothetical protein
MTTVSRQRFLKLKGQNFTFSQFRNIENLKFATRHQKPFYCDTKRDFNILQSTTHPTRGAAKWGLEFS